MSLSRFITLPSVRIPLACAVVALGAGSLWAQPSQNPLLSRDGGGVSPNVVLDLDESGSMTYQHVPEGPFTLSGKTVTLAGDQSLRMHPLDTRVFAGTYRGSWPANIGAAGASLNYQQQVRSPDVNGIYYNPETTYLPWIRKNPATLTYDGTRFDPAVPTAAQFNPLVSAYVPITYVGSGTVATAASGNVTPGLPAGWAQNDLMICLAESYDSVSHVAPLGWTLIYNLKGTVAHSASAFYKIAGAVEAAPLLTHLGGSSILSRCFAYRNVSLTQPFDVAYAAAAGTVSNTTTDTTIDTGSARSVTADTMVLIASHQAKNFGSLTVAAPGGGLTWTQASTATFNGAGTADVGIGLFHANKPVIGAIGPLVVNSNVGERNSGVVLVLRQGVVLGAGGANLMAATSAVSADWCLASSGGCPTSSLSYTPMLFYRLKKNVSGVYLDPTVTANYDSYNLTSNLLNGVAGAAPRTYPTRTDCPVGVCSLALEQQNYANWYVYHRSRILIAQASIAEAFWNVDETKMRVGWGHIHKNYSTVDNGENVATVVAGVRKFTPTQKDGLFDFVRNITFNSFTPLRTALWGVGEYYSKASPWFDDPGNSAFADPVGSGPKDCRRAYHLLVTDGLWNTGGEPFSRTVGNYDGGAPNVNGVTPAPLYPTITSTSGVAYTYVPGKPNSDGSSDMLADFASYFFNTDLRPTLNNNVQASASSALTWQGMVNFAVGIGLKGTLDPNTDLPALKAGTKVWGTDRVDDLWHATVNSEGKYFNAKNSAELAGALSIALSTTLSNELREAGVATASAVLKDGNRKYVPNYKTGRWSGDILAYELDANGIAKVGPGPENSLWAVSSTLPVWSARNIYTWNSTTGAPSLFNWASIGALNQLAIGPAAGTSALVDYIKGDATNEASTANPAGPYRARDTRLGDFINSNPVLVKAGTDLGYKTLALGGSTYDAFVTAKALRDGFLFVGGNDGMLHAFKDTNGVTPAQDGKEVFAYVPRAVYPNLTILSDKNYGTTALYHQFFVDGALGETDAFVKATAASASATWRNYLLGSLSAGGRAVFAMDVTDMTAPGAANIKWEFSNDVDLGYVSAPIEAGVLPNGSWVAIFGNGPLSPSGKAVLFVLDLATGAANKLVIDAGAGTGLGGVGVQRDASGYITNLFVGDLKGSLWKLNYDATALSKFAVDGGLPYKAFFNAALGATPQPITQAPMLFNHSSGGKLVVFGTGKLLVDADRDTIDTQSMYSVWDKTSDSVVRPMTRASLASRSLNKVTGSGGAIFYSLSGGTVDYAGSQRGWVIDLTLNDAGADILQGERVIYPPARVSSKLVLLSSVAPAKPAAVCTAAVGLGANFVLPVETGLNPTYKLFDVNGDTLFNASDAYVVGYATNVDGIDSVIKSATASAGAADGACGPGFQRTSFQNTTGQVGACVEIDTVPGAAASVLKDRIWRRIINPPIR